MPNFKLLRPRNFRKKGSKIFASRIYIKIRDRERWLRCFGHLKRMGSDRIPKIILKWNVEGRRKKEKLREYWMDRIRRTMISKDFTEWDAEDRELWRGKISLRCRLPRLYCRKTWIKILQSRETYCSGRTFGIYDCDFR